MKSRMILFLIILGNQTILARNHDDCIANDYLQLYQPIGMLQEYYSQKFGKVTRVFTTTFDEFENLTIHTKSKSYRVVDNKKANKSLYRSEFGQDKYANEHFFKNKRKGVFVDIGAHNGVSGSNSYFFEKSLGWSGICVEPLTVLFQALKRNRNCICLNCCISDFNGEATFIKVNGGLALSGLEEKIDPRHWDTFHISSDRLEKIIVACYTPQTIFPQYGIDYIDFLSIDTEGGELDILKAINFSKVYVDVITVEINYKDDRSIYNYLTANGYQYITHLGVDELYKRIEN